MKTLGISRVGILPITIGMFLRSTIRKKDGKRHSCWSVVENKRVSGGRVVQKHVLYLGEINGSQELAWRKSIEVLKDGDDQPKTLALFPEDRCAGILPDASIVRLRLSDLQPRQPRGSRRSKSRRHRRLDPRLGTISDAHRV